MRMNIFVSTALLLSFAAPTLAQSTLPVTPTQSQGLLKVAPKIAVYDESADAGQQIAAALAKAKKENRRVLIQWGGNWCSWCIRLHEVYRTDAEIKKKLLYEYDTVFVDTGKPIGKNVDLAKSYGADVEKNGYPFLTILDADGKPIANQETASLETKNAQGQSAGVNAGYNSAAVLKFLDDHKATYENANQRLDHAIADAKIQNKVVFLHFGAPWCIWCHRLEDWMARPEINSILTKNFIDCKIDIDRTVGGNDLEKKYTDGTPSGIPVFFFIDGDSKVLANSLPGGTNIGFPAAPQEIAHFEKMLQSIAKKLSAQEIQSLVDSLQPTPQTSR